MAEKERTHVEDIDRSIYDVKDQVEYSFKTESGLTEETVREISAEKNEPQWMLDFRLKSLEIYNRTPLPAWGPDISDLRMDDIISYIRPKGNISGSWDEVPEDIKNTFDRLGIPEAEQTSLAGVGAQYDSEVVYHSIKKEMEDQGVIYTTVEQAMIDHEDMVKEHFMKLIPPTDHKFAALHGAVWSGGSFVYVPPHTEVSMPLQSYFRLNAPGAGQFEHTLIIVGEGAKLHFIEGCSAPKYSVNNLHAGAVEVFVGDGASMRYSTIENWSKNMYNLNTKRAKVGNDANMEWVSGAFGSRVTMLYPMTILAGDRSHMSMTSVVMSSEGQDLDTGMKVAHLGKNTTSEVSSKSISKGGGSATTRTSVVVGPKAEGTKAMVACESLMLDNISRADTIPAMDIQNDKIDLGHEAKIGRISDDLIFYFMSRGIKEEEAKAMIVRGFVEPITKELPLEYAVEMNNLINLEFEGAIG